MSYTFIFTLFFLWWQIMKSLSFLFGAEWIWIPMSGSSTAFQTGNWVWSKCMRYDGRNSCLMDYCVLADRKRRSPVKGGRVLKGYCENQGSPRSSTCASLYIYIYTENMYVYIYIYVHVCDVCVCVRVFVCIYCMLCYTFIHLFFTHVVTLRCLKQGADEIPEILSKIQTGKKRRKSHFLGWKICWGSKMSRSTIIVVS